MRALSAEGAPAQPGTAAAPLLAVEGLSKQYGGVRAVDGVSFEIQEGSITGLIGPNGAGKSTVLAVVSGFTEATEGRISLGGEDISSEPMHRRARRGLVRTFQIARVFGGLTALENLLVAVPGQRALTPRGLLEGRRHWREQEGELIERAYRLLATFSMLEIANQSARTLSGGQRRAVEIMRALMMEPRLLLLDEPMAGLNPHLVNELEDVFNELRQRGLTLLLIEHELDTVERICDEVLVMAWGRVIARGLMAELRQRREVQDAYVVG
ncbi:MAG: ABC transporter ATP-binding protein [Candidatus Dormibacteria bacterium]